MSHYLFAPHAPWDQITCIIYYVLLQINIFHQEGERVVDYNISANQPIKRVWWNRKVVSM
jgi:hypothetical protein